MNLVDELHAVSGALVAAEIRHARMNELKQHDPGFIRGVEERLQKLRDICPIETVEQGRARLAFERPPTREPFDKAVDRRLRELRALMQLTTSMHAARTRDPNP